jgi:hypothetical protein
MSRGYPFLLILILFTMLCGCQSLPNAKLGNCEDLDYNIFKRNFQVEIPEPLQYRYTLHWHNKTLIANCITHKDKNVIDTAGISNLGITLYSARWQDNHFEILKNNTGMPDKLLKRSILCDALLLYYPLPKEGSCIRRNVSDESLWLETNCDLAGGTGYFVILDNQPGWGAIRDDKIYFKAIATKTNNNTFTNITIENFKEGYKSEIRLLNNN